VGVGLENLLNAEDVTVHVDLHAILVAIFPGFVLVNRLAAIKSMHIVKSGPINDLAALVAADAAILGLVNGIVAAAVARIITAAEAEVNVYVDFRLSLLNRSESGEGNSNSGCSDEGLGDHLFSPGLKLRFVMMTGLAILETETRPLNLNGVRTHHSFSVHFFWTLPLALLETEITSPVADANCGSAVNTLLQENVNV
jgi:hypothetical protein